MFKFFNDVYEREYGERFPFSQPEWSSVLSTHPTLGRHWIAYRDNPAKAVDFITFNLEALLTYCYERSPHKEPAVDQWGIPEDKASSVYERLCLTSASAVHAVDILKPCAKYLAEHNSYTPFRVGEEVKAHQQGLQVLFPSNQEIDELLSTLRMKYQQKYREEFLLTQIEFSGGIADRWHTLRFCKEDVLLERMRAFNNEKKLYLATQPIGRAPYAKWINYAKDTNVPAATSKEVASIPLNLNIGGTDVISADGVAKRISKASEVSPGFLASVLWKLCPTFYPYIKKTSVYDVAVFCACEACEAAFGGDAARFNRAYKILIKNGEPAIQLSTDTAIRDRLPYATTAFRHIMYSQFAENVEQLSEAYSFGFKCYMEKYTEGR